MKQSRFGVGPYDRPTGSADQQPASSAGTPSQIDWEDPKLEAWVSRIIVFSKIPEDVSEEEVKEKLAPFGDIRRTKNEIMEKGTLHVEYWDIRHSEKAHEELKGLELNGNKIDLLYVAKWPGGEKEENLGTLYVRPKTLDRGFVDGNTMEAYEGLFGQKGEVKQIKMNKSRAQMGADRGEKFVEYYDLRAAEAALKELTGYNLNGTVLDINYSRNITRTLNKHSEVGKMIEAGVKLPSRNPAPSSSYAPMRSHGAGRGGASSGYQGGGTYARPPPMQNANPYGMYGQYGQGYSPYGQYGMYGQAASPWASASQASAAAGYAAGYGYGAYGYGGYGMYGAQAGASGSPVSQTTAPAAGYGTAPASAEQQMN